MNKKRAQQNADRQARLSAIQSQQRASERKRNSLIFGGIALVIVAVIVAVTLVIVQQVQENNRIDALAGQDIEGAETFEDLSVNHVDTPVEYEQTPPVGGNHSPIWTNCGVYTETIPNENTVHSMEHGAVWITYQSDLAESEIDTLTETVGDRSHVVLSPYEGLESPIVASAWGLQLNLDSADDERLAAFLAKYVQGEQTPEPGATCSGGITPAA